MEGIILECVFLLSELVGPTEKCSRDEVCREYTLLFFYTSLYAFFEDVFRFLSHSLLIKK